METFGQFIMFAWLAVNALLLGCVILGSLLSPEPPDSPKPQPGPEGNQPPANSTSRE